MKYKILLPLLVSGVFFYACSKDKTGNTAPGDTILEAYYSGSAMEIKELAIYTNNSVINDPAVIQDFINRNVNGDARSNFFVGMSSVPVQASNRILYFLNDNRVNIDEINMKIETYQDSIMLVKEYTYSPTPKYYTTCSSLLGKVPAYTAYNDCPDSACTTYQKAYPILTAGANYYAPLLSYAVVTKDCAATATAMPVINIKNPDLQSQLNVGDSVLIQYAKLPLIKQTK